MKNFFILFFILFLKTNLQIKENPIVLIEASYPFLLNSNDNDYYYIITKEKSLKIEKISGVIVEQSINLFNVYDFIHIVDNSNNNYLYKPNSNKYYQIIYNPFITYSDNKISNANTCPNDMVIAGSLSSGNIIYGYSNEVENSYIFITFPQNKLAFSQRYDIVNKMSCKLIGENKNFICIVNKNNDRYKLYIDFYEYIINNDDSLNIHSYIKSDNCYQSNSIISSFNLYDIEENEIKLLCLQNEQNIQCKFFKAIITTHDIEILGDNKLVFSQSNSLSDNNCYIIKFNFEYLLCCAFIDYIDCFCINSLDYNTIKEYKLSITQNNAKLSYLSIVNNNEFAVFGSHFISEKLILSIS